MKGLNCNGFPTPGADVIPLPTPLYSRNRCSQQILSEESVFLLIESLHSLLGSIVCISHNYFSLHFRNSITLYLRFSGIYLDAK